MDNQKDLNRAMELYQKQIQKDNIDNQLSKEKFATEIKNGLGVKISDINTYIKKEPSIMKKIKTKLLKFFKYL